MQENNNSSAGKDSKDPSSRPPQRVGLPEGTHIGKYEIRHAIGCGSQSIVYLGYDRLLDRPVAIKQISANLQADPRFLKRFRSEAKILAQLGSEGINIVSIYDLVENDHGLFIAMEYVNGRSLKEILAYQKHALPLKIAGDIILAVARGLSIAHKANVVHRDVKPGNIMVTRGLEARIMDFGVAAQAGQDDSLSLGTTKYMAPEVFKGATVDFRSDIYSLGMMAYEMLTGREFFDKLFAEVIGDGKTENLRWMKWHCDSNQKAPDLNEINLLIQPQLGAVIAKMMAKDASQRYESIEQVIEALQEAISVNLDSASAAAVEPVAGKVVSASMEDANRQLLAQAAGEYSNLLDEELDLTVKEPKTARKIIAAVLVVAVLLLVGVLVSVKFALDQKKLSEQSAIQWSELQSDISLARNEYKNGHLDRALDLFAQTGSSIALYIDEYATAGNFEKASSSWQLLCQLYSEMIEGNIAAADATLNRMEELDGLSTEDIDSLKQLLTARSDAVMYLDKLDEALTNEDMEQARIMRMHYEDLDLPPVDLSQKAAELFTRLDEAERQLRYKQALDNGDVAIAAAEALLKQDDLSLFDQAAAHIAEAETFYAAAAAIKPAQPIGPRLVLLEKVNAFMDARKQYLLAPEGISLDTRIELLQQIVDSRVSDDRTLKLYNEAMAEKNIKQADQLSSSELYDDMLLVRQYLTQANKLVPSEELVDRIADVEKAIKSKELLRKADEYDQQMDYANKLRVLNEAAALSDDVKISELIDQAKIELYTQQAIAARKNKQWDKARELLEQVRSVDPQDAKLAMQVEDQLKQVEQYREFYAFIEKADEYIAQGDYPRAIRRLIAAREIGREKSLDMTELNSKLNMARYTNEMNKAKKHLEQNQPELALPLIKTAMKYHETEEAKKLYEQAERQKFEKEQAESQRQQEQEKSPLEKLLEAQ